jgi:hypothetical protein
VRLEFSVIKCKVYRRTVRRAEKPSEMFKEDYLED